MVKNIDSKLQLVSIAQIEIRMMTAMMIMFSFSRV
jgi:hypothetical protein